MQNCIGLDTVQFHMGILLFYYWQLLFSLHSFIWYIQFMLMCILYLTSAKLWHPLKHHKCDFMSDMSFTTLKLNLEDIFCPQGSALIRIVIYLTKAIYSHYLPPGSFCLFSLFNFTFCSNCTVSCLKPQVLVANWFTFLSKYFLFSGECTCNSSLMWVAFISHDIMGLFHVYSCRR